MVGLYLDPPDRAGSFGGREVPDPALDRTQPGTADEEGRAGTMTHDDKRRGTTTLFAALDVLDGRVIGPNAWKASPPGVHPLPRPHRAPGLARRRCSSDRRQLRHPRASPKVKAWLARHHRFRAFLTASASWLIWSSGSLAKSRESESVAGCSSVVDLQRGINDYLEIHNADPKPFVWTASASAILEKVNRGKQALESQH